MLIHLAFKHMEPSEAVKHYATEKTEKLKKYFRGKIHVTWTFSVGKEGHSAHCHLVGNQMDYFGETESPSMHASIDLTVEKIETQLRRHKEKIKDHKH